MFEVKGMFSTGGENELSNTVCHKGAIFNTVNFPYFLQTLRLRVCIRYKAIRREDLSPSGHIIQAQHEKCQVLACEKSSHVRLAQTYFHLASLTIAAAYQLFVENWTQTRTDFLETISMRKATFHHPVV